MKIPFGMRRSDSRMVTPDSVPNGLGCDCVCRDCRLPLIAKQGEIKEWHFAHACGAECPGGVESAIHQMAKQMIMDRQYVYAPKHSLYRRIHGATWATELAADIQPEGLIHLRNCRDEVKVEARQPDVSATMPNGQPIAIEVAFTHFCDQEKIEWMSARNLTTLEIDIFIPQSTSASDVVVILNERLFGTAANSRWLHHAGEARALAVLDEQERALREQHAKADAAHEARDAAAKAKRKRTDEFVEKIRDIDYQTFRLSRDLTLRIAHSKIRVTMKGHGYFTNVAAPIKQIIRDAAKRFGGEFNKQYTIWQFSPPESRVVSVYNDLRLFVRSRLEEKPDSPPEPGPPPEPTAIVACSPLNLPHDEEELFEERAAIMENEGGLSREEAEKRAYQEITERRWQRFTR